MQHNKALVLSHAIDGRVADGRTERLHRWVTFGIGQIWISLEHPLLQRRAMQDLDHWVDLLEIDLTQLADDCCIM